jgi:hypothetical protein
MNNDIVIPFLDFLTATAVPVKFRIENADVVIVEAPTGPLAVGRDNELVILPAGGMYTRVAEAKKPVAPKKANIFEKGD